MSRPAEVERLSRTLGVQLRKVTRTDVFAALRAAMDRIEIVGARERIEAAGYNFDEALCEVDEGGGLLALFWPRCGDPC